MESFRTLRSSPVTSALVTVIAAVSTAVILLATAETLQAERTIVDSLETPDLRLVILRDIDGSAGLPPHSPDRIRALSTVEWSIGLGEAEDIAVFEGATRVPLRALFGMLPTSLRLPPTFDVGHVVLGEQAIDRIGLDDGLGTVFSPTRFYSVGGKFDVGGPLRFLSAGAVRQANAADQISQIILLVGEVGAIESTVKLAIDAAGASKPGRISVSTPNDIEKLRAAVHGEIGRSGRRLTQVVLAGAGGLLALITSISVLLKRTDLGRRRALGATRGYVLLLVLSQTAITSGVGAIVGAVASHLYRWFSSQAAPAFEFSSAVVVLVTGASILAGLIPAIAAAKSDPIKVLRLP